MDQTSIQNKIKNARHALVFLPMALGDFTYWQLVLRAFTEQYPQLRLDLMPDEYFINTRFHRGSGALVNPIICDWAAQTGIFHDVYADLYTGDSEAALARAKKVGYDVVFVMSSRGRLLVAEAARALFPQAAIVSWSLRERWFKFGADRRRFAKAVDFIVPENPQRFKKIIQNYNYFFQTAARMPTYDWAERAELTVPAEALERARRWREERGIAEAAPLYFINPFAKNKKRTWPLPKVAALIRALSERPEFQQAVFLINGLPSDQDAIAALIRDEQLPRTYGFTAAQGFWDLPAMLAHSRLIISVETAIMHIASLLHRPQIILMRLKNPEWVPVNEKELRIIWNRKRRHHIKDIEVAEVIEEIINEQ